MSLPPSFPRLVRASAAAALLAFTLSVFVPLVQTPEALTLDWLLALSVAHEQGLRFGREILFTYGPLGFAWAGYHPATFHVLLALWAAVAVATWAALWSAVRRLAPPGNRALLAAGAFGVVLLAAGEHVSMHDSRFLLVPMLLLFHHFIVDRRPLSGVSAVLVAALAIAGLVKFSYLVSAGVAVAAVAADSWPQAKGRAAAPLVLLAGLYLLGWLLTGQRLADLAPYLSSSIDVVGGYTESMALWTPTESWDVLRFVGPASLLLALVFWAGRRQVLRQCVHVGALGALLLLVFRAGYVRHDEHEIISTGLLVPLAMLYLLGTWRAAASRAYRLLWIVCVGTAAMSASVSYERWAGLDLASRSVMSFIGMANEARELSSWAGGGRLDVAETSEALMKAARAAHPLAATSAKVDLYPTSTHLLLAAGLDYRPRPSLQSYPCGTPFLTAANAEHLRGAAAPEQVFFRVAPMDGRLATLEDPLSWLELARLYDAQEESAGYLVLRRSATPRTWTFRQLAAAGRARLGSRVVLPDLDGDGALWVRVDLRLTAAGHLASQLYKPPLSMIGIELSDGQTKKFRFLPGSAGRIHPVAADRRRGKLLAAWGAAPADRPADAAAGCLRDRRRRWRLAGMVLRRRVRRGVLPSQPGRRRIEARAVSRRGQRGEGTTRSGRAPSPTGPAETLAHGAIHCF